MFANEKVVVSAIKNKNNQVQNYLSIKPKNTIATMHCYMMAT